MWCIDVLVRCWGTQEGKHLGEDVTIRACLTAGVEVSDERSAWK